MAIRTDSVRRSATAVLLIALTTGLAAGGCTGSAQSHGSPPGPPRGTGHGPAVIHSAGAPDVGLVAFGSCDAAHTALRQAAELSGTGARGKAAGPGGTPTGADSANAAPGAAPGAAMPAQPGGDRVAVNDQGTPDHSTTNVAEAGVDEPDLVKTDGTRIVSLHKGWLYVADPKTETMVGGVPIAEGASDQQLLLSGDKALVLSRDPRGLAGQSVATLVDIGAAPAVVDTFSITGAYLDARLIGSTARVVVHAAPVFTPTGDWMPSYTSRSAGSGHLGCDHIEHPAVYSGTALLTLLTFDLSAPTLGTGQPLTVVADGDVVYADGTSLYVANDLSRWRQVPLTPPEPLQPGVQNPAAGTRAGGGPGQAAPAVLPAVRTELYRFDISGTGQPRYVAAGAVPGWPVNQYSMSEYQGDLRIATTTGNTNALYVLRLDGTNGTLRQIGALTGLGEGERLYGVRYAGPTAYLVTFRQTDPLFTVDLRDPTAPKAAGQLLLTGYSAYLHPVDDKTLIGLGQAANAEGVVQGTQVSLFDVSDPAAPRLKARFIARGAHSTAENDPHAFFYRAKTGMLVLPLAGPYTAPTAFEGGALVLHIGSDSITETGVVGRGPLGASLRGDFPGPAGVPGVTRALMVDDTLWTVSGAGLTASDGTTLADIGWIPYP